MTIWTYHGRKVQVSPYADIPGPLQMGSKYDSLVQRVLQAIEPWEQGESPHKTRSVRRRLRQPVILNGDRTPQWGIYIGHRFQDVDVSPFVVLKKGEDAPFTNDLTIELSGTPDAPVIDRAYAGPYQPPLPWENRANWETGGVAACVLFWSFYSRVFRGGRVKGDLSDKPPAWYLP